jgi:DNA invertase Pin-like site-specific DNA recombinase
MTRPAPPAPGPGPVTANGVQLWSQSLAANVPASVAQHETEIRSERGVAGQAIAKECGVRFGHPKGAGKRIKVTPEQKEATHRLKAEDKKSAAIARATGLARPTIYSVIGGPS